MRKSWWATLLAALGIGVAVAVASAKDMRVDVAAVQADSTTWVAHWKTQCNATGCPDSIVVTWKRNGAAAAYARARVVNDTLHVLKTASAAPGQTLTMRAEAIAWRGSKSSAITSAERTVTGPAIVTPPVDSTPRPVDSLRVDTLASGGSPPDTTPAPPTGGFVNASHFPSDLVQWFDDDLDNMAQDEYPNTNRLRLYMRGVEWRVQDPTTPYSDGAVRIVLPSNGYGDGYGVGGIIREEGAWPRMYTVSMEKFEGSGGLPYKVHYNEEKTLFPRTHVVGPGGASVAFDNSGPDLAYVERNGRVEIQLQNGLGSPRRWQNFPVYFELGKWQKVEHYMQANTPGKSDGIWRMWINGQLAADHNDVLYSNNAAQVGFNGVRWETVRGGGRDNGPTPPGGQFRIYDRLAVYVSPTIR